ncbi:MAG: phosphopantothenoylcysteine synthetase/decarboxylase [Pseudohongiellaceae bacterium]|jgi:phosphopantothenoylcysteine synthetase/decarboxylase
MRVLVTAGGTREPVDDVRVLTNSSTGRLGAHLADVFAAAGHDVLLLHSHGAVRPQRMVARQVFGPAAELGELLKHHVPGCDAVIHAAAVSDFVPDRTEGKISSGADELVLVLRRAPKLIDGLRALAPGACLVGFKLTSGSTRDERLTISRSLLDRAQLDLVVSNDVSQVDEHDHEVMLIGRGAPVGHGGGKAAVAAAILRRVEELVAASSSAAPS